MDSVKKNSSKIDSSAIRRDYSTPALTRFGKVSQLTQSASGCAKSDNAACLPADPGNMGVKKPT